MHHRFLSWLMACAFLTAVSLRAQTPPAAATPPPAIVGGGELILVAKVSGTVNMTLDGQVTQLAVDSKVPQKAKINTLRDSSVVLVFSNGATTQLGSETELIVEEFVQDPFATKVEIAKLTEEPTASRTRLKLNRGELVGKVAKLRQDKGSTFVIDTPVGAAGIRGTTFRIVFIPSGTGLAYNFQLSTLEGNVAFAAPGTGGTGTPAGGAPPAGGAQTPAVTGSGTTDVPVVGGQQISITVDVTINAAGVPVVTIVPPVTGTVVLPPATSAALQTVATEIVVATTNAVFTPAPTPSTPSGTPGGGTPEAGTSGGTSGGTTGGSTTGSTATINNAPGSTGPTFSGTVTTPPRVTSNEGK